MTHPQTTPVYMQRDGFGPGHDLTTIRETDGVQRIEEGYASSGHAWMVTRFDDAREVLASGTVRMVPTRYEGVSDEEYAELHDGMLIEYNPPDHTRLRRLLTPEFTPGRVRALQSRITEIVDSALDDLESAGKPADLVALFASPVPSLVICELLGVPYSDREEFQERTRQMMEDDLSQEEELALTREDHAYMRQLVTAAREKPGDDILGRLIRQHGHGLRDSELAGIASLLLVAGHETTANMLGIGTLALLRHPDQLAAMRDDPASVDSGVEELLRWLTVVPSGMLRTTTADLKVNGHVIPAGAEIIVSLTAADRDPRFIDEPDRLDVRRGSAGHLAFGHGIHHCLGASLARMEMRIAFPAMLRRFPNLALAVPFEQVRFRGHQAVYGLRELPVTW